MYGVLAPNSLHGGETRRCRMVGQSERACGCCNGEPEQGVARDRVLVAEAGVGIEVGLHWHFNSFFLGKGGEPLWCQK